MNVGSGKLKQILEILPIVAAFCFHAIAFDRWLLATIGGIGPTLVLAFDFHVISSTRRWYIAAGIGMLAGVVMLAVSVPPSGLLSPALSSALTGMLIGVAVLATLAKHLPTAWISAWLLVALSGHAAVSPLLLIALVFFIASSSVAAASLAGVFRAGRRVIFPLGLFAAMTALATYGIAIGAQRLDGAMVKTLEALIVNNQAPTTVGIGSRITINAISKITLSKRPILDLSAKPGLLRAHIMDQFNGQQWSTSSKLLSASHRIAEIPVRSDSVRRIEMIPLDELAGSLPAPAGTWDVLGANSYVAGGWILRGEPESAELTLIGDGQERLPREEEPGAECLVVPDELRSKLGPLTEKLTSMHHTDREKTSQVEQFFQDNFEYSLETNLASDDHPLVTLVTERRPAYCIYFASAMAVMLRTQGISTRIVSGFAPGQVNRISGRTTVRQLDAHAWVEVWLPEESRFVAFDPTPGTSRRLIVGQADRIGIFSAFSEMLRSSIRRTRLAFQRDPTGSMTRMLKSPISWLLLAILFAWFIKSRSKTGSSSRGASKNDCSDPVLRQIYQRYVHAIKRAGVMPLPSETDDELIARLETMTPPAFSMAAKEFIRSYREARYRGDVVDNHLIELAKLNDAKAISPASGF